MLIILEGPDGAGKSTIARRLARILNAKIIHCTKDTPNSYDYFKSILLAAEHKNIIADRFCYGQFVYQSEEERRLTLEQLYKLESWFLHFDAKVIYVTASENTITNRLQKRGEEPMLPVSEMIHRFDEVMGKSTLQVEYWRT